MDPHFAVLMVFVFYLLIAASLALSAVAGDRRLLVASTLFLFGCVASSLSAYAAAGGIPPWWLELLISGVVWTTLLTQLGRTRSEEARGIHRPIWIMFVFLIESALFVLFSAELIGRLFFGLDDYLYGRKIVVDVAFGTQLLIAITTAKRRLGEKTPTKRSAQLHVL